MLYRKEKENKSWTGSRMFSLGLFLDIRLKPNKCKRIPLSLSPPPCTNTDTYTHTHAKKHRHLDPDTHTHTHTHTHTEVCTSFTDLKAIIKNR